jgi:predicted DNA-binding transcriptional regulator AlpA
MVGLGKTLIYRLIAAGDFPIPYKPGGSVARWSENEIVEWLAQCAARRVQ